MGSVKHIIKFYFLIVVTIILSCISEDIAGLEDLNVMESVPCFKYACTDGKRIYKWKKGVEVWVVKDADYRFKDYVYKTALIFDGLLGIHVVYRGEYKSFYSEELIDYSLCEKRDKDKIEPDYKAINIKLLKDKGFEGILFLKLPDECLDKAAGFAIGPIIYTTSQKGFYVIAISNRTVDIYRYIDVFAHEFAHALGLKHATKKDASKTITNPFMPGYLSYEDLTVLWYLYGPPYKKERYTPVEAFSFIGHASLLLQNPEMIFIDIPFWQGICAIGGVYPYVAIVEKGNCILKETDWVNCWGIVSNIEGEECEIKVIDSLENSTNISVKVLLPGLPKDR